MNDSESREPGAQGIQGIQGAQGFQGIQGIQGISLDHDMLIEMRTDLRHMRAHFDNVVATVSRLDRDAVTHSALRQAMGTLTGIVLAIAGGLGLWLHK